MVRARIAMWPDLVDLLFGDAEKDRLCSLVDVDLSRPILDIDELPEDVELLVAGWGMPSISETDLDRLPHLRAVVHTAGGVGFLDAGARERGVVMSTNRYTNGIPVAEWTVSLIVLAAKGALWASRRYCAQQHFVAPMFADLGLYRRRIGIVSASNIGTLVMEMLRNYDVEVLLFDPYVTPEAAAQHGVELVGDLQELARRCDILSLHAPVTEETKGMISKDVLAAMPDGATLINTSRGIVVDQDAMVEELLTGRINAMIDVTEPEPLPAGHPLFSLPNVFLTPHLAGSVGSEIRRLGVSAIDEVERYVRGHPFERLTAT